MDRQHIPVDEFQGYCTRSGPQEPGAVVLSNAIWGCVEFMVPKRSILRNDRTPSGVDGNGWLSNRVVAG